MDKRHVVLILCTFHEEWEKGEKQLMWSFCHGKIGATFVLHNKGFVMQGTLRFTQKNFGPKGWELNAPYTT